MNKFFKNQFVIQGREFKLYVNNNFNAYLIFLNHIFGEAIAQVFSNFFKHFCNFQTYVMFGSRTRKVGITAYETALQWEHI